MQVYMTIVNTVALNPSMMTLEGLIWNCSLLRSILLEISLVKEEEIDVKNPNALQKICLLRKLKFLQIILYMKIRDILLTYIHMCIFSAKIGHHGRSGDGDKERAVGHVAQNLLKSKP